MAGTYLKGGITLDAITLGGPRVSVTLATIGGPSRTLCTWAIVGILSPNPPLVTGDIGIGIGIGIATGTNCWVGITVKGCIMPELTDGTVNLLSV